MRSRLTSALSAVLFLGAGRLAFAAPPAATGPDAGEGADDDDSAERTVQRAIGAWRRGEWTTVRDLLEPLVRDRDLDDELLNESALRYLTEATLYDPGLPDDDRETIARGYIERQLERDPDWEPPSGLHGKQFYDLVARVRSERDAQLAEACRGQLLACEADFKELSVDHEAAQDKIAVLREDLANEDVFLTEIVKRNRGLALLPFGIGHLAAGDYALGGSFLALELVTGVSALSLLVLRSTYYGCVRTDGFKRNSLICIGAGVQDEDVAAREKAVLAARSAETILGWTFIGAVVLDLTVAQLRFEPVEIVERGERTRRELEDEIGTDSTGGSPDGHDPSAETPADPGQNPAAAPGDETASRRTSVRLRFRPHPTPMPIRGGFGLGFTLQF